MNLPVLNATIERWFSKTSFFVQGVLDMTDIFEQLVETAQVMVAPGKGILAMDESTGTIEKPLNSVGVESTEETRLAFCSMLLTTAGLIEHVFGTFLSH